MNVIPMPNRVRTARVTVEDILDGIRCQTKFLAKASEATRGKKGGRRNRLSLEGMDGQAEQDDGRTLSAPVDSPDAA
jgi:hypothetical protein